MTGPGAIESAIALSIANFEKTNTTSKAYFDESSKHLHGANTRTTVFAAIFPLQIISGHGSRIVSADKKEYLDMLSEYTAGMYGHSNEEIVAAVTSAMRNGFNLGATGPLEGQLAGLIKTRFQASAGLEMLRFTNSGTEGNLLAVAASRAYTGKTHVLVFKNAYHGSLQSFREPLSRMNIPGDYFLADYNSISSVNGALSNIDAGRTLAAILGRANAGCWRLLSCFYCISPAPSGDRLTIQRNTHT